MMDRYEKLLKKSSTNDMMVVREGKIKSIFDT